MATTKSPRRVLQYAYLVGLLTLRLYSCKYSRKTYNRPQLFACLVLKEFMQCDYRKITALLRDSPDLAAVIELKTVPHFTTMRCCRPAPLRSRRKSNVFSGRSSASQSFLG
jgi:hypothetical protein